MTYLQLIAFFLYGLHICDGKCTMPEHFTGDWFSIEEGTEIETVINAEGVSRDLFLNAKCESYERINKMKVDFADHFDSRVLLSMNLGCFQCWEILYRTPNILQFRSTACISNNNNLTFVCGQIHPRTSLNTLFRRTVTNVNCKQTFEGIFHFTYEQDFGGGGICRNPRNRIIACQEPGSTYLDNQVFYMNTEKCVSLSATKEKHTKFQCMGTWRDEDDNVFSAVVDLGADASRFRFRCLLTRTDQQVEDNKVRWTMSRYATCESLRGPYDGDIRLQIKPSLSGDSRYFMYGSQFVVPTCKLPRNFTGTWFTAGEFDTDVTINGTHIYFKTKIDQFTFRETYFTCQQYIDSRYLMTAVTVGKCEIDYVCFDFLPRHHNIIRWRMSKPYRLIINDINLPNFLDNKFRQTCSWSSFTYDRKNSHWTYNTFLLNPPAPVDCPIGGRYNFTMVGAVGEQYKTRVEGITPRPRHHIDCRTYTSVFESCTENSKKLDIDVEYCSTVDHSGRPIGEYDIPDRELSCVGYWMEDMKSYMLTYDEEDSVSRFRCWVYERLDWRDIQLSRATRALCGKNQLPTSYKAEEGASLSLILKEKERIYDNCPQRYDDGRTARLHYDARIYVLGVDGVESYHSAAPSDHYAFLAVIITGVNCIAF